MSDLLGQTVAHYRLESLLGDGGMGAVYRAYDLNLERPVAIKLMHAHFARQPEFRIRLTQEAKTAAQLDHPSIVRIFDFGESEQGLYIAMEYLDGGNLRAHLQRLQARQKFLPLNQSLQIGAQIAEALDYAHRARVVHRDVKPGNIILKRLTQPDEPGEQPFRAVLTDFGLVKLVESEGITRYGTTLGTPTYMSPEQCEGSDLDGRSDLYSLGVVLYELFTNQLPFRFKSLSEAMAIHIRGEMPQPPSRIRTDLPPFTDTILVGLLAKNPSERYASGRALAADLRSALYSLEDRTTRVMSFGPNEPPPGYKLRIETPGHDPSYVNLTRSSITLGRDADNHIVLPVEGVSRFHARLQASTTGWEIVDLGGVNGTWLNQRRLPANEREVLKAGDGLQIGPYRLVLEGPLGPSSPVRPESDRDLTTGTFTATSRATQRQPAEGALAVFLARDDLSAEPGREIEFKVEVANRGEVDDRVNLRIQGLPAAWLALPDAFTAVPAGGSATIPVMIRPPKGPETPSGRQRFRIELISQQYPEERPAANVTLNLDGFEAFEMEIEPRRITLPDLLRVTLRNTGNLPVDLSVVGRDEADQIQFRGERGRIPLQPNQVATVDLRLEPRHQSWFGSSDSFSFKIDAVAHSGLRQSLSGAAQVSPILPASVGYVALFFVIFICALSILFFIFRAGQLRNQLPTTSLAAEALTGTAAATAGVEDATGTFAAGTATSAAATGVAATAVVFGDRDGDGLSDVQEAILGTNPDNPDTDADGLSDGQEVLTWGTNPLNRDTDADVLSDGDEVLIYGTNPRNPDTDGDGYPDGLEVAMGWDPLDPNDPPRPSATATLATSTITPTPGPSDTPTPTPSPTLFTSPTPTPTATSSPTATPTEPPTATATSLPPLPPLSCLAAPPVIDGTLTAGEWGEPVAVFDPDNDQTRRITIYLGKSDTSLYLAYAIADPTENPQTDSLKIYLDAIRNLGDPDTLDRLFEIGRDGSGAIRAGIGTNNDGLLWDDTYTSNSWTMAVGETGDQVWVVEIAIDLAAEMPIMLANEPFGMMLNVSYTGSQAFWPEGALANDAGTWREMTNAICTSAEP
jgi:serine/threonine protein kinase